MSYTPLAGSIAFKVIEHLKTLAPGEEIATGPLGDAIGHNFPEGLNAYMGPAIDARVVSRRIIPEKGRMNWWRMGSGAPTEQVVTAAPPKAADKPKLCPGCSRPICAEKGCVAARLETLPIDKERTPVTKPPASPPAAAKPPVEDWRDGVVARAMVAQAAVSLTAVPEPEPRPADPPRPFDAWFSGVSGEVVLQGVTLDDDGDVVLSREQVRFVMATLTGVVA